MSQDPRASAPQDNPTIPSGDASQPPAPVDVTLSAASGADARQVDNSPFAPFRYPAFRLLWAATLGSSLGGLVQAVGAAWLMTSLTSSSGLVALVQGSNALPVMMLSLLAGALADNFDRRRMMLAAQVFMCVISALLTVAAYMGVLGPWSLLAFTFLIGCGTALHNPAWQTSIRELVPKEQLHTAVALNSMGFNMMRSVGPAIGGVIVAVAGAAAAFAVNAVSYLALILGLARWRSPVEQRNLPRETLGAAMAAGVRYVAMSPNIMRVLSRSFVFGVSAIAVLALLPLVARDVLHGGPLTYGILFGAYGVGAIGGALGSPWLRTHFDVETTIRVGFLVFAVGAVLLGWSTNLLLSCAALMLSGAAWVLALSLFNVSVQLSAPRWVVGRAIAIYQSVTFGGMALGSWLWGTVANQFSPGPALMIAGVTLLAGAILGLVWRLPEYSSLDLDPLDTFTPPSPALDLKGRSGPIQIMVDYQIAQDDVPRFLELMTQRRRIRLRDGARNWALLRDLENPRLWTESYHVPTWVEYIRHHDRRTRADAENYLDLRALHIGPEPLQIRRMIERQTVPGHDDAPPIVEYPRFPSGV